MNHLELAKHYASEVERLETDQVNPNISHRMSAHALISIAESLEKIAKADALYESELFRTLGEEDK